MSARSQSKGKGVGPSSRGPSEGEEGKPDVTGDDNSRTSRDGSPKPKTPPTPTSSTPGSESSSSSSRIPSGSPINTNATWGPRSNHPRTDAAQPLSVRQANTRTDQRREIPNVYFPESSRPENFKQTTRTFAYFVGQSHFFPPPGAPGSSGSSTSPLLPPAPAIGSPPSLTSLNAPSSPPGRSAGSAGSPPTTYASSAATIQTFESGERSPPMSGADMNNTTLYEHSVLSANSTLVDLGTPSSSKTKSTKSITSSILTLDNIDDNSGSNKKGPFVEGEDGTKDLYDPNDPNSLVSSSLWRKHFTARGIDPDRMEVESFINDAESIKFMHPFDESKDSLTLEPSKDRGKRKR